MLKPTNKTQGSTKTSNSGGNWKTSTKMPPGQYSWIAKRAAYGGAKMAGRSAWKRYNPWRKGGRWGPKGRNRGKMRISGYYGRYNKRASTGELKFHDLIVDDTVVSGAGAIDNPSINLIAQGTTESERIGRKCTIKSIHWRYDILYPQQSAVTGGDVLRVILYLDKQANGATALVNDILETNNYQSFYNLANKSRFRIYMDRTWAINANAGAGNGTANDTFSKFKQGTFYKRCNVPIEFDSTTGAITEIRSNNIGVLMISRLGLVGFTSQMRIRFSG